MIQTWLRFAVRRTPLYGGLRYFRDRSAEQAWLRQPHATGAAPHRIKVRTLREHAQRYGIRTLIETGTLYGDTIWRVRNDFDRIVSIEFAGPATAFARVECAIAPKAFVDFLTLVRVEGRWQILAKVFHYELLDDDAPR